MANRPSVIAALKIKRKSLKQRLGQNPGGFSGGSNVKSRLSFGRQGNRNVRGRLGGGGGGGGQGGRNRGRGVVAIRKGVRWSGFSNDNARSGTSPMLKARLGNQNANKSGQIRNRGFRRGGRGFGRNYRQQRGSNFRGSQFRNRSTSGGAGGTRRKGRGGRQNRGRGRSWGLGASMNKKNIPSKQELDNELDEYMAKTKSHLDADLDAYMAQAES